MSLYLRGSVWWCRWTVSGETVRESAGTADRKEAQEYHDRRRADLWRAEKLGERRVDWDTAALEWLEHHARAKRSYPDDLLRLKWLQPRLTGRALDTIDTTFLLELRTARKAAGRLRHSHAAGATEPRGVSESTVNRYLAVVSAVLHYAAARAWITAAPKIPYFEEPEGRIDWFTPEEAAAVVAELERKTPRAKRSRTEHLARMARFTLATGLRRANVTGLQWANVDFGRRVAWAWPDEMKAGRSLAVPLNDDAIAVLRECWGDHKDWVFTYRGQPVTETKTRAWDEACSRAGITRRPTWHVLRHTWATWMVMQGTPLEVLMKLGGWASIDMVLRYAHFAPGYLAEYADRIAGTISAQRPREDTPGDTPKSLNSGVADGIRTHDNRNHNPHTTKVVSLDQLLSGASAMKRRRRTA